MSHENFPEDPDLTSGRHISYWTDSAAHPAITPLDKNLQTDVVIIGAGLGGMTTAYCLARSGKRVVVLEDGAIGSGETGRTTAHLTTALDDRYYNFQKTFGEDKTKLLAESHAAAIDFVEEVVTSENIDCQFTRLEGYLFLHPSDKKDSLERELEAASKAGITVSHVNGVPGITPQRDGLRFTRQAKFHPMKYIKGLEKSIRDHGGQIFTGTHAGKITHKEVVTASGFTVTADHVVVATNAPVNSVLAMPMKQFPYRTYVIGALIKKDSVPDALWWDTGNYENDPDVAPYHYVRLQDYNDEYDLLISGGEDHPTGDTSGDKIPEHERYSALERWTREFFPIEGIIYKWSGQVMEPMDGVAYIGRNPFDHDNVYIITGDSGNGMTHCTIGGMLISDLINGKENPWAKLYSPSRFTFSESGIVFRKLFAEIVSYLKQQPNLKSAQELSTVGKGEGRIVDMLEEKYGVYRDADDQLFIVSAECTHMKCSVAWNADEKSWDCPCHGSRFTYQGKVINGPANRDLPAYSGSEIKKHN